MRDSVLWRKQTSIVMLLAKKLNIEPSQALDVFYSTKTAQQLVDPSTGLQLMSDLYIVDDIVAEINGTYAHLYGKTLSLDERAKQYDEITTQKVNEFAKRIANEEVFNVVAVGKNLNLKDIKVYKI